MTSPSTLSFHRSLLDRLIKRYVLTKVISDPYGDGYLFSHKSFFFIYNPTLCIIYSICPEFRISTNLSNTEIISFLDSVFK